MRKNLITVITLFLVPNFVLTNAFAETNSSAKSGKALQIIGAAANTYQGVTYMQECTASSGFNFACVLSAMSFAQAALMVQQAMQSNKTKEASDCTGPYCNGGGPIGGVNPGTGFPPGTTTTEGTLPPDDTDVLGRIQDDITGGIATLGNQGYSYDPATNSVNTPTGSVAASSLSSSAGLKGLGMSDADISKMDDIGKKALQEATKMVDSFDGGSGGGGRKSKGGGYDEGGAFDMNKYLAGLMNKKPDARGVAGLEKKYGSDQIGVAQDNIFKMINRRYEAKKSSLNP